MDEWYSPAEIIFSRPQILFLLKHLDLLAQGIYPPEYADTGYTVAPPIQRAFSRHAPFETPIQFHAEVTYRLGKTGIEGKLLLAEIKAGMEFIELSPESKRALAYCSGWRRRSSSYTEWKKKRKWRAKRIPFSGQFSGLIN